MIYLRLTFTPVIFAALVLLSGCAVVGRDSQPPTSTLLDALAQQSGSTALPAKACENTQVSWWNAYGDSELNRMVSSTIENNRDLRAAWARVRAQKALVMGAEAGRRPALDAAGSATRRGNGDDLPSDGYDRVGNRYQAGLIAGWEIDLWGAVRRQIEQAVSEVDAASAEAEALRLALIAETVRAFLEVRTSRQLLSLSREEELTAQRQYKLSEVLRRGGLADDDATSATSALWQASRQRRAADESRHSAAHNRLAVVCGVPPAQLQLADNVVPLPVSGLPDLVPADLIRRRPDILAMEHEFAARVAATGVAQGELYPSVRLDGMIGMAAGTPSDLLRRGTTLWSFGIEVRWGIFRGGAIQAGIAAAEAHTDVALARYEQVVLQAVQEVLGATAYWTAAGERLAASEIDHRERLDELTRARARQRAGISSERETLDLQLALLVSKRQLVSIQQERGAAFAGVLTALGCGWQTAEFEPKHPSTLTENPVGTSATVQ